MLVQPFPFGALRKVRAVDLGLLRSALGWLGARAALQEVLGVAISLGAPMVGPQPLPTTSALVWLVRDGVRALIALPGGAVREVARRLLSLPLELPAPRPLTSAEHSVAALGCAAALAQLDAAAQVEPWQPVPELRHALARTERFIADWPCISAPLTIDGTPGVLRVWVPPGLVVSCPVEPAPRFCPPVTVPALVVVAAAPLSRAAAARLAVRDIVVVEPAGAGASLRLGRGEIGLRAVHGATQAIVDSSYVRRAMEPLPDDVHVELTVALGGVSLSLRQVSELAVGQVVSLGRPLEGPFELRLGAKVIGAGELVDVDGALGVRVLSLSEG